MSMFGELSFFFEQQISQSSKDIFISQTKHIKDMLKKFKIEYCKPMSTPMIIGSELRKDNESMEEDKKLYSKWMFLVENNTTAATAH